MTRPVEIKLTHYRLVRCLATGAASAYTYPISFSRRTGVHMPDVELGNTNTADNETTIKAQGDSFIGDSVFRADARTAEGRPRINGLRGDGIHGGAGVIGGGGNPQQTATVPAAGPGVIGRGGPVGDRHPGLRGAGVIGVGTGFRDAGSHSRHAVH